ncbi:unnamed protein product [Urochloa decumbens]|uniref:Uncharacterized protein n=1 Tax=Urochloa decumbens TaxID=240449 RepID=A0ABC8VB16_9POAL
MWGLRWGRRRRRRTARVVDESALTGAGGGGDGAAVAQGAAGAAAVEPTLGGALARSLLALACAVRFDGEDGGATEEAAWAASGWRPRADEVSHLMVRESMRYAIYA